MFHQTSGWTPTAEEIKAHDEMRESIKKQAVRFLGKDEAHDHAHRNLRRISNEIDDSLRLIETGDMSDFELAVQKLDELSHDIHKVLDSPHGESDSPGQ